MSLPAQNLHDFVLNLLTDDAARSAFAADPTAALTDAGLSDVTPQDIQEVAPLVAEYAPDLSALPLDLGALPLAAPDLGALPLAAPDLSALPLATPDLSALPLDASDLSSLASSAPGLGDLPISMPDLGTVEAEGSASADGAEGSIIYDGGDVQAAGAAIVGTEGVAVAGALATPVGSLEGDLMVGPGGVHGGLSTDSPLGQYELTTDGMPASAGDLASTLDSEVLSKVAPAAGTVASFVSTGGDLLAGGVEAGSNTLGSYLTSAGAQAGAAVSNGGEELSQHIAQGTDLASAELAHPALPAVPALDALPAVDALPAAAADLPANLPVHLPAVNTDVVHSLPLPHLPVANPLPAVEHVAAPVTDIVSHSPLGDVTSALDHTVALPDVGGLAGDLPLGH